MPGTVAVILLAELNTKEADTVPSLTRLAPVKPVPLIVILAPVRPEVGVKFVIVGGLPAVTVNEPALVPVPPAAVTEIFPVVAPEGTVAVILMLELTV